jgi:hypothetical protein
MPKWISHEPKRTPCSLVDSSELMTNEFSLSKKVAKNYFAEGGKPNGIRKPLDSNTLPSS